MKKCLILVFIFFIIYSGNAHASFYKQGKDSFFKGNYKKAAELFYKSKASEKLIRDYSHYYRACSYLNLKEYEKAIKVFDHLLRSYPRTPLKKKAGFRKKLARYKYYGFSKISTFELMALVKGFLGEWKNIEAKEILDLLMRNRSKDKYIYSILYSAARVYYRIEGEEGRNKILNKILGMQGESVKILFRLERYKEVYNKYPGSGYANHALRKIAIEAYINGDIKLAYRYFKALRLNYSGSNSRTALYWMAKCQEKLGNSTEAKRLYKKFRSRYPNTYYGYRCASHLGIYLGPKSKSGTGYSVRYNSRYWYLAKIGAYDDAGYEVRRARIRVNYPYLYKEVLKKYGKAYNIDPLFMAALFYGESMFIPQIVSPVGAIGIGQIMPFTGQEIAKNLNIKDFKVADLFKHKVNIRFSFHYVSQLLKDFDKKRVLVLCNYNAGPEATRRWYERAKGVKDIDAFIENIGYRETRNYAKKVIKNYWIYQRIYSKYSHKTALKSLW